MLGKQTCKPSKQLLVNVIKTVKNLHYGKKSHPCLFPQPYNNALLLHINSYLFLEFN